MAVLLELSGANMFRTRSYQNASRLVGSLSQDLGELVASGEIFNLKGIGKGLGTAISQAVGEGRWPEDWEDLHTNTPEGLIEMLGIPGVGPKKIKMLHDELGVLSVADLQEACVKNEVAPMKGFRCKKPTKNSRRYRFTRKILCTTSPRYRSKIWTDLPLNDQGFTRC